MTRDTPSKVGRRRRSSERFFGTDHIRFSTCSTTLPAGSQCGEHGARGPEVLELLAGRRGERALAHPRRLPLPRGGGRGHRPRLQDRALDRRPLPAASASPARRSERSARRRRPRQQIARCEGPLFERAFTGAPSRAPRLRRCRSALPWTASGSPTTAPAPGRPPCCCTAGRDGAPTTATSSRCSRRTRTSSCPTCAASASPTATTGRRGEAYSAEAQAASVLALIEELGLDRPVLVGYDIGSRIARTDRRRRTRTRSARSSSPRRCPGVGERILSADAQREFWYQPFHNLDARRASSSTGGRTRSAPTCATSGSTGARPAGRCPPSASTSWSRCTRGPARSRPASPGTARGPAAWRPRSPSAPRPGRPRRRPHHGAVGRARAAVPARVVGPPRRVLRRLRAADPRGRRPLHAAGGAAARRRGYGPGSTPVMSTALPATPASIM